MWFCHLFFFYIYKRSSKLVCKINNHVFYICLLVIRDKFISNLRESIVLILLISWHAAIRYIFLFIVSYFLWKSSIWSKIAKKCETAKKTMEKVRKNYGKMSQAQKNEPKLNIDARMAKLLWVMSTVMLMHLMLFFSLS